MMMDVLCLLMCMHESGNEPFFTFLRNKMFKITTFSAHVYFCAFSVDQSAYMSRVCFLLTLACCSLSVCIVIFMARPH